MDVLTPETIRAYIGTGEIETVTTACRHVHVHPAQTVRLDQQTPEHVQLVPMMQLCAAACGASPGYQLNLIPNQRRRTIWQGRRLWHPGSSWQLCQVH